MLLMRLNLLILLILLVLHKTQSFVRQVVVATPLPVCQAQQTKRRMPPIVQWRTSQVYNLVTSLLQAWHLPIALQTMRGHTLLMVLILPTLLILLMLLMLLYLVMLLIVLMLLILLMLQMLLMQLVLHTLLMVLILLTLPMLLILPTHGAGTHSIEGKKW